MKIDSISTNKIYTNYTKVHEKTAASSTENAATDKVELSKEAVTFSAALKVAKQAMETNDADRIKKINAIKQQIESGTYNVSGEDIAEKMMDR